jgi:predicted aspartyl protease
MNRLNERVYSGASEFGIRIIFVLLLPLFVSIEARGQSHHGPLTIPTEINGVSLRFLIDTGSTGTVVDPAMARHLGLRPTGAVSLQSLYSMAEGDSVIAKQVRIGPQRWYDIPLVCQDLTQLSLVEGTPISGVLGTDLLATMKLRLSYPSGRAQVVTTVPEHSSMLTLRRVQGQYFVPVTIGPLTVEMLLDTGTSMTALSSSVWEALPSWWKPARVLEGIKSSAIPTGSVVACVPTVRLGETAGNEIELLDHPVRIIMPLSSGIFATPAFSGLLGGDALEGFEVTLDLEHASMYLTRDEAFRPDQYEFVTVGIQFFKSDPEAFSVAAVWKNSPAEAAGILVGDHILSVDGHASRYLDLQTFADRLHGPVGTPVVIEIKRAARRMALSMKTRDLVCHPDPRELP